MNNQNLILLGIGVFVGLIVTAVALDQAFLAQNDPMDPAGLLARVETAFERVKDLEIVLNVVSTGKEGNPMRMRVWYISGPDPAIRVLYLAPTELKGEIYTADRDLLSHYIPNEDLTVIKRWAGFPLSHLGLARFDLQNIKQEWKQGKLTLRVSQNIPSFDMQLFPCNLVVTESLAGLTQWTSYSLARGDQYSQQLSISAAEAIDNSDLSPIPGGFVLRVYDKNSGQLTKMVSIDRDTFLVEQIVLFVDNKRTTTIYTSQLILNQELNRDQILVLPRGTEIIRG